MHLPSDLTSKSAHPWRAWEMAVRWNLDHLKDGIEMPMPPLARSLHAKERRPFIDTVQDMMSTGSADICYPSVALWQAAMNVLATTWPLILPELRKLWNKGLAEPVNDGDLKLSQVFMAGLGETWGPPALPMASCDDTWEKANAHAPWAYHALDRWWETGKATGWGNPDVPAPLDAIERFRRWTDVIVAVDDRMTPSVDASHWRLAARQTLFSLCAGRPCDATMQALAKKWTMGWPQLQGGPGMADLAAWDAPIHWAWNGKLPQWQGLGENLIQRAMKHHLDSACDRLLDVPEGAPDWMVFLNQVLISRQPQPASHFPDAQLQQAFKTWRETAMKNARQARMPGAFEPDQDWVAREALWRARVSPIPDQWMARFRQWKTQGLDVPQGPSRSRPRARA